MSQILVSVQTYCKCPVKTRSVCNEVLRLADVSYTCVVSWAAVTLGGPTATRWARHGVLLLVQLPVSQRVPSGAPWGAALRTPHWVPVTPVTWSRWGEKVKEKEMRGKSRRGGREGGNINICPYSMERSVYDCCALLFILWQSMSASSPLSFVLTYN